MDISFDFGSELNKFKDNLIKSKKYWVIYLIFILIASLAMFNMKNYAYPSKEILFVGLTAILGVFAIAFYSYHNADKEIYKTAFVLIMIFGLLCCFLNPICNVSDETEHLARADITSQGVIVPEYKNNAFSVSESINFFEKNRTQTAFQVDGNMKYSGTLTDYPSAFQHNPFYGYVAPAIGLAIAKLLGLSVLAAMWLGRLFNLILYAFLASYAIKKTPILKVPFIAMVCMPVAIQQAASFSLDALFISLGFVVFAYFFYMIKAEDKTLENKDILIFSVLCLLFGLCRLPCLASILLIFCVPTVKFKAYNAALFKVVGLFLVGILGLVYAGLSTPNYMHSAWRAAYAAKNNISSSGQIAFMLSHPGNSLAGIFHTINALDNGPVLTSMASLYSTVPGGAKMYRLGFISAIYPMFVGAIWFLYPLVERFDLKERIGALIVLVIIYLGTCLSQMISWAPVGDLYHIVVHTRYFIPLFVLVPFIFGINHVKERNVEIDSYIICLTCVFMASFIIQIAIRYY